LECDRDLNCALSGAGLRLYETATATKKKFWKGYVALAFLQMLFFSTSGS
jgi:hypothetical protein